MAKIQCPDLSCRAQQIPLTSLGAAVRKRASNAAAGPSRRSRLHAAGSSVRHCAGIHAPSDQEPIGGLFQGGQPAPPLKNSARGLISPTMSAANVRRIPLRGHKTASAGACRLGRCSSLPIVSPFAVVVAETLFVHCDYKHVHWPLTRAGVCLVMANRPFRK
jgi:hypothetical protein